MIVPVMNVGIVGVRMHEGLVGVPVSMRLPAVPREGMLMLMMRVMPMRMLVLERSVRVFVQVPFGEMQPHTNCHQHTGKQQRRGNRLPVQRDGECRAEEWREREIRTRTGRTELA